MKNWKWKNCSSISGYHKYSSFENFPISKSLNPDGIILNVSKWWVKNLTFSNALVSLIFCHPQGCVMWVFDTRQEFRKKIIENLVFVFCAKLVSRLEIFKHDEKVWRVSYNKYSLPHVLWPFFRMNTIYVTHKEAVQLKYKRL